MQIRNIFSDKVGSPFISQHIRNYSVEGETIALHLTNGQTLSMNRHERLPFNGPLPMRSGQVVLEPTVEEVLINIFTPWITRQTRGSVTYETSGSLPRITAIASPL